MVPRCNTLAWARADSAGIVDPDGALVTLVNYMHFRTTQNGHGAPICHGHGTVS